METKKIVFITLGVLGLGGIVGVTIWQISEFKKQNDAQKAENKKLAEQLAAANAAAANAASAASTPISSYGATPFKNADEGNRFRKWLNLAHPDDAKALQIDPAGAYDNAYIRKAFAKYGSEYFNFLVQVSNIVEADKLKQQLAQQLMANTVAKKVVTPKGNSATVRNTPEINDGLVNNRLMVLPAKNNLDYLGDVKGTDQLTWYKVKANANGAIGYVRSDVANLVTIRVPV